MNNRASSKHRSWVGKAPLRLLGRYLKHNGRQELDDRAPVVEIGTVFTGDIYWGEFQITVHRSSDSEDRGGLIFEIQSAADGFGFVPYVKRLGTRLLLHQAGADEARAFAALLRVATRLAEGEIEQAAAEARALGLGLSVPTKVLVLPRKQWPEDECY